MGSVQGAFRNMQVGLRTARECMIIIYYVFRLLQEYMDAVSNLFRFLQLFQGISRCSLFKLHSFMMLVFYVLCELRCSPTELHSFMESLCYISNFAGRRLGS